MIDIIEGHIRKAVSGTALANGEVEKLAEQRLAICKACKKADGSNCLSETNRCCNCTCDMEAKARVNNMVCPLGKW